MRLIPSGTNDGPKPITPIIKLFIGLIVTNALAGVMFVAWFSVSSRIKANGMTTMPLTYLLWGFLAFDVILIGTFLLLNQFSKSE